MLRIRKQGRMHYHAIQWKHLHWFCARQFLFDVLTSMEVIPRSYGDESHVVERFKIILKYCI